jgi:transposase
MKKKNQKLCKLPKLGVLQQIKINAGGIDVGDQEIWVAVAEDRSEQPVKQFGTFTSELHEIAVWLKQCAVDTIAMESTGIYWIPLYEILEQNGIEVYLVNARHVKNVAGRKTDILDCQWLQQLHTYGLLAASFIPDKHIRQVRLLSRHRDTLLEYRAGHIQHMQKALHQMNLQLDNVISDITGKTGRQIIRAIIDGQRDPKVLAGFRDPNCKNSQQTIEKSLIGLYDDTSVFQLQQALELYDFYTQKIRECEQQIKNQFDLLPARIDPDQKPLPPSKKTNSHCKNQPDFDLRTYLYRLCGVDLTAIDGLNSVSVYTILSETGLDMSRWPTVKHFTSWLSLCPNNKVSGGKLLSSKTQKTANRANKALRQAAQSLHRSQSYLGAYYRRMRTRLGAAKAITATAHKLARIIYLLLKEHREYLDLGEDYFLLKNRNREITKLTKKAYAMGFYLSPVESVS